MTQVPLQSRMRLPRGFRALRPDLGEVLRAHRKDDRVKQQTVADAVGVARETLSRIEAGRTLPSPDTLDRLMAEFHLDWDAVALREGADARERVFHDTLRGESCFRLGRAIRARRKTMGLGLREAGARCGLSAAQLSRLERGEALTSSVLAEAEGQDGLPSEKRIMVAAHPFLRELVAKGAGPV